MAISRGRYEAVVFDVDGTLADTGDAILTTVDAALSALGLPAAEPDAVRAAIGLPLADMFRTATRGRVGDDDVTRLVAAYRQWFGSIAAREACLFPGIAGQLDALAGAGTRLGVATSKSGRGARELLDRLGVAGRFTTIVADDMVEHPKPHPQLLLRAVADLGVGPAAAVMVGDTTFDVLMGRAAGVRTCAVTWGNHARDRLVAAGPDHVADAPADLARVLGTGPAARPGRAATRRTTP